MNDIQERNDADDLDDDDDDFDDRDMIDDDMNQPTNSGSMQPQELTKGNSSDAANQLEQKHKEFKAKDMVSAA